MKIKVHVKLSMIITTPSRKRPAGQPQARKLQALGQRRVIVDNEQDSVILFSNVSNFNIGILVV